MKENYFMRRFIIILFVTFILINGGFLYSIEKFYTYYDKALKYMQKGEWERAIAEFKSAASLEFEDARKKRTYGTRFIKYFPHREMGICYYNLDEFDNAMGELQLSYAYKKSKRSEEYIKKLSFDGRNIDFEKNLAERKKHEREQEELALRQKEMEEQKQKEEELARKQKEIEEENKRLEKERKKKEKTELAALEKEIQKKQRELEKERKKLEEQKKRRSNISKLPLGALTYDPNAVTQVGSRLSVAVLTFASNEKAQNLAESVTEKLVTQLVNLRRFRVIERSALDKIMEEQKLGMTGFVDDETAVKVGKLAGADLIVLGRINIEIGFAKVSARGIDTETSELIVAKEVSSGNTNIETIERLVEQVAIDIYNIKKERNITIRKQVKFWART
jgi:TolB-like protein